MLDRWLATIPSLADHPLKVGYARRELLTSTPEELATALDAICRRVDGIDDDARDVLGAFVPSLVDPALLEELQPIRHAARDASLPAASRLLRCSSRQGHLLDRTDGPARKDDRVLTLGERRALARKPSRAMLTKLLLDPHPLVVRIVLANPRVTEDDVVMMAARRPTFPEVAVEIGKAWSRRPRARLAVVLNPGSPPAVSVPMLGLLARHELAEVMRATDLLPVVRATASELHELRPPLRSVERPPEIH
ncbi:MAG: hypothetical protein FJ096_05240 [Deltaproteobacteria bacterium]|nr:hypothetical protein [Deltaproteobacteria bacterium]